MKKQIDSLSVVKIKTADICARGRQPEDILSNLCSNDFCFDGVQCCCMESFLQSLKLQDEKHQRMVCLCKANELERCSVPDWNRSQPLWWKGTPIDCHSPQFNQLIHQAYEAMYLWSARFRETLMATAGRQLICDSGNVEPDKTILTDKEFCAILMSLRQNNLADYKKYKYPRMWPNSYGVDEDFVF